MRLLHSFESLRPFTEAESWWLFRAAAFAETIGWTLLIVGIILEHYLGTHTYVTIAGRIHGTWFLVYMAACVVLYPSLGWSRWRALTALACSAPPYGSLLFERWAAHRRKSHGFRNYREYLRYTHFIVSIP
jgi:integral membrane protein